MLTARQGTSYLITLAGKLSNAEGLFVIGSPPYGVGLLSLLYFDYGDAMDETSGEFMVVVRITGGA